MLGSIFGAEEIAAVTEVLRSGEALSHGRWRERFEGAFRDMLGVRHAITVTSGTVALEVAVSLLDLQPGDEVITTPQTYQATAQALLGKPVRVRFCDVDPNSLNVDVDRLRELLTPRTRAILLVHYGGFPAPMRDIMELAHANGVTVVEDCAHALGAEVDDRRPGSLADIGCFSFQSSKIITTLGEGGLVTFDRDDWAERVVRIRGNDSDGVYTPAPGNLPRVPRELWPGNAHTHDCVAIRHPGTNATLTEPAAAMGLAQLARLDSLLARRREIAATYDAYLSRFEAIRTQVLPPGVRHTRYFYTCFVEPGYGLSRNGLISALEEAGVETWLRYFPIHLLAEWRAQGHGLGECPVAERMWFDSQLNLPCLPAMTDADVALVIEVLDRALSLVSR